MSEILACKECEMPMNRESMVGHLENFHVGKSQLSDLQLRCFDCGLQLSLGQVDVMINHCAGTNHDFTKIKYLWVDFAEKESERISQLIRLGVGMQRRIENKKTYRNSSSHITRTGMEYEKSRMDSSGYSAAIETHEESEEEGEEWTHFNTPAIKEEVLSDEDAHTSQLPPRSKESLAEVKEIKLEVKDEPSMLDQLFPHMATDIAPETISTTDSRQSSNDGVRVKRVKLETEEVASTSVGGPSQCWIDGETAFGFKNVKNSKLDYPNIRSTMSCTLCSREFSRQGGNQAIFIHAMRKHDSSLFPIVCTVCGYGAEGPSAMTAHTKRGKYAEMGCDGTYVTVRVPNLVRRLRTLVTKLFPDEDWNMRIPAGSQIYGHAELDENPNSDEEKGVVEKGEQKRSITTRYPHFPRVKTAAWKVTTPNRSRNINISTPKRPDPLTCTLCRTSVVLSGDAVKHAVNEHDPSLFPVSCASCGFGAETPLKIKSHATKSGGKCSGQCYHVDRETDYFIRLRSLLTELFPDRNWEFIGSSSKQSSALALDTKQPRVGELSESSAIGSGSSIMKITKPKVIFQSPLAKVKFCIKCRKKLRMENDEQCFKHLLFHSSASHPFTCEACEKTFGDSYVATEHLKGNEAEIFGCSKNTIVKRAPRKPDKRELEPLGNSVFPGLEWARILEKMDI